MNIKTYKILENLYLGIVSLLTGKTVEVKQVGQPVNHVWIIDRSGSMWGALSRLIDDLQQQLKRVKPDDTISIAWFSSEGRHDWIVKGMSGNLTAQVSQILERYRDTVGATCFSEVLADTVNLMETLKTISPVFSLMFLSDGHPVVRNYSREVNNTMDALGKLRESIGSALFVGYGDYYNRDLMSRMAERAGGALVHSGALHQFSQQFGQFVEVATKTQSRTKINLGVKPDLCFAFEGGEVVTVEVDDDGFVLIGNQAEIYTLSEKPLSEAAGDLPPTQAALSAAVVLLQRARTNDALACLSRVGDVYLMKQAIKAFTNEDFGKAEEAIKSAITNPIAFGFLEGKILDYLPKPDAFCLLDVFDLLAEDEQAYFLPRHEAFKYKRVGRPAVYEEGYPKFEYATDIKCRFGDFVWNQSRLNLSLGANLPGTIDLGDNAESHGFARKYPTYQFKNYTAIADGIPNFSALPVLLSRQSFLTLQAEGVIDGGVVWKQDTPVILKLDAVTVINQKIAQGYKSATQLCRWAWREQELQAEIKVLKFLLEGIAPAAERRLSTLLTLTQEEFLKSKGIGKNGYAPPKKLGNATDSYRARTFDIKIDGFSSLPSVKVVRERLALMKAEASSTAPDDGKKKKKPATLTPSQALMAGYLAQAEHADVLDLEKNLKRAKSELAKLRGQLQRAKFAVILGREWFTEFAERKDENPIEVDGRNFILALGSEEVKL